MGQKEIRILVRNERYVYLAVNAEGLIKIGISGELHVRMKTLKTTLLGAFRGTFAEEKMLHARLEPHRVAGEWYRDSRDFRSKIKGLFVIKPRQIEMERCGPERFEQLWPKMLKARISAGVARARKTGTRSGKPIGRPRVAHNRPEVLALRDAGKSIRQIAAVLDLSHGTVQRMVAASHEKLPKAA